MTEIIRKDTQWVLDTPIPLPDACDYAVQHGDRCHFLIACMTAGKPNLEWLTERNPHPGYPWHILANKCDNGVYRITLTLKKQVEFHTIDL